MEPPRPIVRLSWSFGLTWLAVTMLSAPGPAAWVELSGSTAQAGVYFALTSLSSALGAGLGGRAMDRFGRRPVLVAAHAQAAAGYAIAAGALAMGSLLVFGIGVAVASSATGVVYLTRLAAGELAGPAERARLVARVQVSATAGAVLGPFLLVPIAQLAAMFGLRADLALFALAPVAFLAAAALVAGARGLHGPAAKVAKDAPNTGRIPLAPFAVATVALVCAQGAMVTVMGVTGVELKHAGHGAGATGLVMALHFVGMFGLSLVVGRIATRVGRAPTIAGGLALLAGGGLVVAYAPGAAGLAGGLFLVGLGWSFAYIAGTVLLTDIVPDARRARVMGSVDFTTAILAALASFAGGVWYAERGITGLGLAAAALVALPMVVALGARGRGVS